MPNILDMLDFLIIIGGTLIFATVLTILALVVDRRERRYSEEEQEQEPSVTIAETTAK